MNSSQVEVDSKAIIATVKPHPFLYDRRIKSSIREKADKWAELGAMHGLSGHQMRTRWTSIKDKYILFKRRAEAYPGTTLGKQLELYKHTDDLTFLNDSIPTYIGLPPKNRCAKYVATNETWERSHTLLVINQLRNFPLLYDKRHPQYHNCIQRMTAYRKIAEVVKRYNPAVTPEMVLNKIRNIRIQFTKAKRDQSRNKQKSGGPVVPKLWFYNRLKFLDEKRTYNSSDLNVNATEEILDKCNERFSQENFNNDNDYNEEDDEINDVDEWISSKDSTRPFEQVEMCYADEETIEREGFEGEIEDVFDQKVTIEKIEPARNQTRNDLYVSCTSLLEILANQIKPYETREKNQANCKNCPPSTLLGKMIESELATVPEHIYIDAKWKIIRILEEAQKKGLREKQDQVI